MVAVRIQGITGTFGSGIDYLIIVVDRNICIVSKPLAAGYGSNVVLSTHGSVVHHVAIIVGYVDGLSPVWLDGDA